MIVSASDDFPEPFFPSKHTFLPGTISSDTVSKTCFVSIVTHKSVIFNIFLPQSKRDHKIHFSQERDA